MDKTILILPILSKYVDEMMWPDRMKYLIGNTYKVIDVMNGYYAINDGRENWYIPPSAANFINDDNEIKWWNNGKLDESTNNIKVRILPNLVDHIIEKKWDEKLYYIIGKVFDMSFPGFYKGKECHVYYDGRHWYIPKDSYEIVSDESIDEYTDEIRDSDIEWIGEKMLTKFKIFEKAALDEEDENSNIWLIGVPSGEAIQVNIKMLDELYSDDLVYYCMEYNEIGFYAFKDSDYDIIKRRVSFSNDITTRRASKKEHNVYNIQKNNFDTKLVDMIMNITERCSFSVEVYASGDFIGFTYFDYYFEIEMKKTSPKYELTKFYAGNQINRYNIATEKLLLKRIDYELHDFDDIRDAKILG